MKNLFLILMLTIATITAKAQDNNNTIKTNATCKAGQERITTELKKLDGVFDVVFSGDGTITLDYSSDGTTYDDLVEKITECGFTANGIEPKNGDKNLCKTEKKTKQ
ncbi:MAG: cation transporter [Bacteroidetes bacterium]|nr:cation transporter [Bacteroidota bacterium]